MSHLPGFLSVRVLRGVNLVNRDATGSDPYVVLHLDNQKVKTGVIKKTVNPVWNEDLTLAIKNPATPIKLEVFDKDSFSKDDTMGDAEFDIEALMQIINMDLEDIRSGTVVRTVRPSRQCCLADESRIIWENGQVVQDILLKLRNVETGVVHLQLKWAEESGMQSMILHHICKILGRLSMNETNGADVVQYASIGKKTCNSYRSSLDLI